MPLPPFVTGARMRQQPSPEALKLGELVDKIKRLSPELGISSTPKTDRSTKLSAQHSAETTTDNVEQPPRPVKAFAKWVDKLFHNVETEPAKEKWCILGGIVREIPTSSDSFEILSCFGGSIHERPDSAPRSWNLPVSASEASYDLSVELLDKLVLKSQECEELRQKAIQLSSKCDELEKELERQNKLAMEGKRFKWMVAKKLEWLQTKLAEERTSCRYLVSQYQESIQITSDLQSRLHKEEEINRMLRAKQKAYNWIGHDAPQGLDVEMKKAEKPEQNVLVEPFVPPYPVSDSSRQFHGPYTFGVSDSELTRKMSDYTQSLMDAHPDETLSRRSSADSHIALENFSSSLGQFFRNTFKTKEAESSPTEASTLIGCDSPTSAYSAQSSEFSRTDQTAATSTGVTGYSDFYSGRTPLRYSCYKSMQPSKVSVAYLLRHPVQAARARNRGT